MFKGNISPAKALHFRMCIQMRFPDFITSKTAIQSTTVNRRTSRVSAANCCQVTRYFRRAPDWRSSKSAQSFKKQRLAKERHTMSAFRINLPDNGLGPDCIRFFGGGDRFNLLDLFDSWNRTFLHRSARGPPVFAPNRPFSENDAHLSAFGNWYVFVRLVYSVPRQPGNGSEGLPFGATIRDRRPWRHIR